GEQALYVTLEEPPEQIMREADLMGFDMRKYYEKSLFFIHLKGRNFKKMIEEQLPQLVKARADYNIKTRVVIDPMTPVIWATAEKLEQRELIGKLFYTLKELGVVLCTVEEHAKPGETIGEDVLLPIYLSDGAIHLEYYPIGGAFNRTVKLLKMRGVHHGEGVYPYLFARGVGIVVRSRPPHLLVLDSEPARSPRVPPAEPVEGQPGPHLQPAERPEHDDVRPAVRGGHDHHLRRRRPRLPRLPDDEARRDHEDAGRTRKRRQ